MVEQWYWLRPAWLGLLPLMSLMVYLVWRFKEPSTPWQKLIATHLQSHLLQSAAERPQRRRHYLVLWLFLMLGIIAAAGPSFQKLPQPAYQLKRATVLVMDMSLSMQSTDIKPDRVTQARFKALDYANQLKEGELALITFAGDAYVISPLTPDHNNIRLLLPDLKPEIMPVQGSNLQSALELAHQLLQQSGYLKGDVVVFSDGFNSEHFMQLRSYLDAYPHRVSVLALGTSDGAPIKLSSGELLKDQRGGIVIPKVPLQQLKQIATLTGGVFVQSRFNQEDVQTLLNLQPLQLNVDGDIGQPITGDQWQDAGVYLIWLMLPLALWLGRQTAVFAVLFIFWLPTPVKAYDWRDFFQSRDMQAQQAYQQKDYAGAEQKFTAPLWQGNAAYRKGDFSQAEQKFRQDNSANGRFNLGNALAQQQKFGEALEAYQQAKQLQPDLPGVDSNIALMESLLQQQQGEPQQQQTGQDQQQGQEQQEQQQGSEQSQAGDTGSEQNTESSAGDAANQESSSAAENNQNASTSQEEQAEQSSAENPTKNAEVEQQQAEPAEATAQQKAITEAWPNATPEQSQQLDGLLRKVQDDPSLLLRNKMLQEYQKRQQQRLPKGVQEEW